MIWFKEREQAFWEYSTDSLSVVSAVLSQPKSEKGKSRFQN